MAAVAYDGGLTAWVGVRDLKKALAWYGDVLGFEVDSVVEQIGWAEMRTAVDKVLFGLSQVEAPEVRGGATLTFGVRDIDTARQALEARDVRFDGETITIPGMVRLATFFDPDGNKLMFSQLLQGGG